MSVLAILDREVTSSWEWKKGMTASRIFAFTSLSQLKRLGGSVLLKMTQLTRDTSRDHIQFLLP